jgi:hypothetical protein
MIKFSEKDADIHQHDTKEEETQKVYPTATISMAHAT